MEIGSCGAWDVRELRLWSESKFIV
jgi:hypothetical protein